MPGLAPVPTLGPVGAPASTQPNVLTELGQAVGQFPEQRRRAQSEQLGLQEQRQQIAGQQQTIDDNQFRLASQRLSVLNKMIVQNPAIAQHPDIVSAYQRAFQGLGMEAPLVSDGSGTPKIDAAAVGALAPQHDFIAQNWPMLRTMEPADREKLVEGLGLGAVPQAIKDIPRAYLQSPAEAGQLLSYVKSSVASLAKPGGSIDNVIAAINAVSKPLSEAGIDANSLIDQLKPDIYAAAMQQAQLALIQAKTKKQSTDAQVALKLLPERIAAIHSTNDLHAVMAQYYPQMAAAANTRAGADAALVGPKIEQLRAQTAKDYADASRATQQAKSVRDAATHALQFGVKNPTALLTTLQRSAHEAQQRADSLQKQYQQSLLDAQTYKGQPYGDQAQAAADGYKRAIDAATHDATAANELYQRTQTTLLAPGGAGTSGTAGAHARAPQRMTSQSKSGRPIYSDDGGATWHYQQ